MGFVEDEEAGMGKGDGAEDVKNREPGLCMPRLLRIRGIQSPLDSYKWGRRLNKDNINSEKGYQNKNCDNT